MSQIYLVNNTQEAKQLSRLLKQQSVRRIYQGIYTDNRTSPIEDIILEHWKEICAYIVKTGILSHRTAETLKPYHGKTETSIYMTSTYNKTIKLPGLTIHVLRGDTTEGVEPILPNIQRSTLPRRLLENLSAINSPDKSVGIQGVEQILAKELKFRGEQHLNTLRDEAKKLAQTIGYESGNKRLNTLISALLNTHPNDDILQTDYAKALAPNQPYDPHRLKLFDALSLYLQSCRFKPRKYLYQKQSFQYIAFFESYFSNFIEGTEFLLDEAEDIAFTGIDVKNRHADSHDVRAIFSLTSNYLDISETPTSPDHLLELLQKRHTYIMNERPDKNPGEFKTLQNKAGNTFFVEPSDVIGTLSHSFQRYQMLSEGMERALFMHFLISEVHPFDDGNGRLARIMMNAELVNAEQYKIIIPSVLRDNYLNGLRLATHDNDFLTYCKVMDQAQAYIASIPWNDYDSARSKIEHDGATLTSDEGLPKFNRVLRKLEPSDLG